MDVKKRVALVAHDNMKRDLAEWVDWNWEKLLEHHLNVSAMHCDFMIGTPDMAVTGILPDGTEVPIFRDGDWTGEFV